MLQELDGKLVDLERRRSIAERQIHLVPMIETALGLSGHGRLGQAAQE
jgi:hypothetical protein